MTTERDERVIELVFVGPPERLDRWLARELSVSRTAVQRAIAEGSVTVDGALASNRLQPEQGARVRVELPEGAEAENEAPPEVPVLYADEHLAFVNKPAGLRVYVGGGRSRQPTLADALRRQFPQLEALTLPEPRRPGMVHRLDIDTSGVMVIGLDEQTVKALQLQFRRRETTKTYLALALGHVPHERALIDGPIGRSSRDRTRMAVVAQGGREARTAYRVVEHFPEASLLEVDLLTGRTHQIRVHLASIGHPVVGDRVYGRRRSTLGARRQMLHAWRLALTHPLTGEALCVEAPLPEDMAALIARLRG